MSPNTKVGVPLAGTVQDENANPILLTLSMTLLATRFTSLSSAPVSAIAPAILCTSTVPATPRFPTVYKLSSTAMSSSTFT